MISQAEPRLRLRGIRKTFGSTTAPDSLDLEIEAGEIHALVGQNGSGKSTLVKILAGVYSPDGGSEMRIAGEEIRLPVRAAALRDADVSFVHQDLGLIPEKTVTQNVAVGAFAMRRGRAAIDWRSEKKRTAELLAQLEVQAHPSTLVADLGPADRSRVAIARALRAQRSGSGVLVLDEPSRALPAAALEDFHRTLRQIASRDGSVLLISHNLEEVMKLSDRVSVLRDGKLVATLRTAETNESEIASFMLGHVVSTKQKTTFVATPEGRGRGVEVTQLAIRGQAISDFAVGQGEVVGLTGLSDDVWESIPYVLAGAGKVDAGQLRIGQDTCNLRGMSPRAAVEMGVSLVPERRADEGLALTRTVTENVILPWLASGDRRLVRARHSRAAVTKLMARLNVQPPDPDAVVGKLSGGNQQKVLLAKWLFREPRFLAMHEPTQAVDVGARETILAAVREVASRGTAVLYASMQAADLIEVCDRVIAYRDGHFTELTELTTDAVLDAVYSQPVSPSSQRITR